MRFMVMHKVDAVMESGERPAQSIIENMGRYIGTSIKAGVFQDGAGLHRSAARVKLVSDGERYRVVRGPYPGGNELLASFALISVASEDRAIELATELARAAGDREIEVGPVVEGWDLTGKPRPADAPFRFLLLRKATDAFERGAPIATAALQLLEAWKREGILQSSAVLAPSSQGARTRVVGGARRWSDGPFTESKELVAGFSVIEVPTLGDAKTWADAYAAILGDNEVDVRVVA